MSKAGNFEIDVWKGGWPVWCVVKYGDKEFQIRDTELSDMVYAATKAMEEAGTIRMGFKEPPLERY
jgi:hypothetical protein